MFVFRCLLDSSLIRDLTLPSRVAGVYLPRELKLAVGVLYLILSL